MNNFYFPVYSLGGVPPRGWRSPVQEQRARTVVARMGRSVSACRWVVDSVGMAGPSSAVVVLHVLLVAVTSDMHVFTDGRIGIIGTGGTATSRVTL